MKQKTMKKISVLLSMSLAVPALSAIPVMAEEKETITITYRDANDKGAENTIYKWIMDTYEKWEKKDSVELDIQPVVSGDSDYFTKIQLQMSDASTAPDIVYDDTSQMSSDVDAGYLLKLDDYFAEWDTWNGVITDALKDGVTGGDGCIYGVPDGTDGRGLWYHAGVLAGAGVIASEDEVWEPANWNEVLDALRAIEETYGDEVTPFYAAMGAIDAESTSVNTYEMLLYGTGEQLYDKTTGLWTIRSQGILDSLGFLQTIVNEGLTYDLDVLLTAGNWTPFAEDMVEGKVGVALSGSWIWGTWDPEIGTNPWPEYKDTLCLTKMPTQNGDGDGFVTMSGGWAWAIPALTDTPDLSVEFLQAMFDNKDGYAERIVADGAVSTMDLSEYESYMSMPYMEQIAPLFEAAKFRPFNGNYSSVSSYIYQMVEQAVATGDAEAAMESFAQGVISVVGEEATQDLLAK